MSTKNKEPLANPAMDVVDLYGFSLAATRAVLRQASRPDPEFDHLVQTARRFMEDFGRDVDHDELTGHIGRHFSDETAERIQAAIEMAQRHFF